MQRDDKPIAYDRLGFTDEGARPLLPGAVLFDVDGTLLDTTEFILGAYEHAFASVSVTSPPRERLTLMVGRPLEECYQELLPSATPEQVAQLCITHREFQVEHPQLSFPYAGVDVLLTTLKQAGIRLGAVTNRRKTARMTLQRAGLDGLLDVIVDGDDVLNHKPNPEGVLFALRAVGVEPDAAFMVGDAPVDIHAGRAAGAKTVGVTYGFQGELIRETLPDYVVSSVQDLQPLLLAGA